MADFYDDDGPDFADPATVRNAAWQLNEWINAAPTERTDP